MSGYVVALDSGTTSCRAIAFDRAGNIAQVSQLPLPSLFPQPGVVEQDATDIWEKQSRVFQEVVDAVGGASQVAAVGITNQRETIVLWETGTGKPVYPAIVWQCRRSTEICEWLKAEGKEEMIREKTGLLLDPYFSATKLTWLFAERPDLKARAENGELRCGTVDSWLLWNLTGGLVHATDVTNASRTLLYNIHTRRWDEELLELFGVPEDLLPEVRSCSEVYGTFAQEGQEIPIAGIAGDQQAALFGQACFQIGTAKNTYGTGCFLLLNTGETPPVPPPGLLTTVAWEVGGKVEYALEGSVFVAGAAVQWLRDGLGLVQSAMETQALAESVPDTGGVYVVPAFTGLGAPYWQPEARGLICGITRGTTKAHLVRATLESIAYQTRDCLEAMTAASGITLADLRVDGGAMQNDFLAQFQADILGVSVTRPVVWETTARGAAFLAGLAVGFYESKKAIAELWQAEQTFVSQLGEGERERLYAGWQRAVGFQVRDR